MKSIITIDRLKRLRDINYCYSWLLQKIGLKTGLPIGKPLGVIIVLTNRCNAKCFHCNSWKLTKVDELTTVEWKDALLNLRKWLGPVSLSVTGGETFIKKDFMEIIEYGAGLGFNIELLTNGYAMNQAKAERLINSGVKRIVISLDGSKAEIHDKVRGIPGFFDRSTNALKLLAAARESADKDVAIWSKTVIMSHNQKDFPNIVSLAKKLRITGAMFQPIEATYYSSEQTNRSWFKSSPLWIKDKDLVINNIDKLIKLKEDREPVLNSRENLELFKEYFVDPGKFSGMSHFSTKEKKTNKNQPSFGLQIMPDGQMVTSFDSPSFGNVKDDSLSKSWKNRK